MIVLLIHMSNKRTQFRNSKQRNYNIKLFFFRSKQRCVWNNFIVIIFRNNKNIKCNLNVRNISHKHKKSALKLLPWRQTAPEKRVRSR